MDGGHMGAGRNVARTDTERKTQTGGAPGIDRTSRAPSRRDQLLGALALASDARAMATLTEAYVLEKHREMSPSNMYATTRIITRIAGELGTTLCNIIDRDERHSRKRR
jgi:hypothetical protein